MYMCDKFQAKVSKIVSSLLRLFRFVDFCYNSVVDIVCNQDSRLHQLQSHSSYKCLRVKTDRHTKVLSKPKEMIETKLEFAERTSYVNLIRFQANFLIYRSFLVVYLHLIKYNLL